MNRRRVLQSFFSLTAGCAVVHCQTAIGGFSIPDERGESFSRTLIKLLQDTIRMCDNAQQVGIAADQREATETRQICQIAIRRVQHSVQDAPAFWQACSDSVSRFEAAVSAHVDTGAAELRSSKSTLHKLHSLKKHLEFQVFQAIGEQRRLA